MSVRQMPEKQANGSLFSHSAVSNQDHSLHSECSGRRNVHEGPPLPSHQPSSKLEWSPRSRSDKPAVDLAKPIDFYDWYFLYDSQLPIALDILHSWLSSTCGFVTKGMLKEARTKIEAARNTASTQVSQSDLRDQVGLLLQEVLLQEVQYTHCLYTTKFGNNDKSNGLVTQTAGKGRNKPHEDPGSGHTFHEKKESAKKEGDKLLGQEEIRQG
ncbi:hypothetical protein F4808DRAFT_11414 [Astrocystis sublimbata]|nr:hypothetical protein F4808DRAFT_11414 [Astrocystis sublimbata]